MKNLRIWIVLIVAILLLILGKVFFLAPKNDKSKSMKSTDMPLSATAYVVKGENAKQEIYVSGEIMPFNQVMLRGELAGKVLSINFKEGEYAERGELLVKINDADFQAQLKKNKAQLELARQKKSRLEKLKQIDGVSQEELDIVENEISILEADENYLDAQIAKTEIRAPFPGNVGIKNISEGAFVTNNDIIATLVQLRPSYIDFSLPEKYSSLIVKGMKVSFQLEKYDGNQESYTASITVIEPTIDPTTKTLKVRATYTGDKKILGGSFVKVYLELHNFKDAVMVPTQSIIPILKGQKLFVKNRGIAKEVKVLTGVRTDDKIQILEGINVGDTVLTSGLLGMKDGSKLKIVKLQ